MSLDRIKQTVPVVGTGPVQLSGGAAPGGFRPFLLAMNPGDAATVCIIDQVTYDWEVTTAVFGAGGAGGTLTRTATIASSNHGLPVNFSGNSCDVFATASAQTIAPAAALTVALAGLPNAPPPGGGPWLNGGVVMVA